MSRYSKQNWAAVFFCAFYLSALFLQQKRPDFLLNLINGFAVIFFVSYLFVSVSIPDKFTKAVFFISSGFQLILLLIYLTGRFSPRPFFIYNGIFCCYLSGIALFLISLRNQVTVEMQFLNIYMLFSEFFRLGAAVSSKTFNFLPVNAPLFQMLSTVIFLLFIFHLILPRLKMNISHTFFLSFTGFIAIPFSMPVFYLITNASKKTSFTFSNTVLSVELNRMLAFLFLLLLVLILSFIYLILNRFYKRHNQLLDYEKKLVFRQRLESLGRLSASIAHEMNNSLSSIAGFTELLLEKELSPDQRKYLTLIKAESAHLEGKLAEILNFARARQEKNITSVTSLIEETLDFIRKNPRLAEFEISVEKFTDQKLNISAAELKQVFLNLVLNAAEACSYHGTMKIYTQDSQNSFTIYFKDSGPGIAESIRQTLFEPFITTRQDGNGLGLFISQQIMLRMDGELSLISSEKGACFAVKIPKNGVFNETDSGS